MNNNKVFVENQLRPCLVMVNKDTEVKGLFHRWTDQYWTIGDSYLIGGYIGGQTSMTYGIVEYEDGTTNLISPTSIKFVDNKINNYIFLEKTGHAK